MSTGNLKRSGQIFAADLTKVPGEIDLEGASKSTKLSKALPGRVIRFHIIIEFTSSEKAVIRGHRRPASYV